MKLHKPTVKWCLRRLDEVAAGLDTLAKRTGWDSTTTISKKECDHRAYAIRRLAEAIKDEAKRKW